MIDFNDQLIVQNGAVDFHILRISISQQMHFELPRRYFLLSVSLCFNIYYLCRYFLLSVSLCFIICAVIFYYLCRYFLSSVLLFFIICVVIFYYLCRYFYYLYRYFLLSVPFLPNFSFKVPTNKLQKLLV